MTELYLEDVFDVNSTYAYVFVYSKGDKNPFLKIWVTDEKKLVFTVSSEEGLIDLTEKQMGELFEFGKKFAPQAIADEEERLKYFPDDVT